METEVDNPSIVPDRPKIILSKKDELEVLVDTFINKYDVTDLKTKEVLQAFPMLCFLLGRVTEISQGRDSRPDDTEREVYYLQEGSGLFGLKNAEDAIRWKGIFNHIMGLSRQTFYLAQRMTNLTEEQRQKFTEKGFDIESFSEINPVLLRDFCFLSHAGRRQVDELKWHDLHDEAHTEGESQDATLQILKSAGCHSAFIELMRVESHIDLEGKDGRLPNIVDNVLTYSDWTFGNKPNTLDERFEALRKTQRAPEEMLDILEQFGRNFEEALKEIVSPNIFEEMVASGMYDWEKQIREAYASSAGLTAKDLYPELE